MSSPLTFHLSLYSPLLIVTDFEGQHRLSLDSLVKILDISSPELPPVSTTIPESLLRACPVEANDTFTFNGITVNNIVSIVTLEPPYSPKISYLLLSTSLNGSLLLTEKGSFPSLQPSNNITLPIKPQPQVLPNSEILKTLTTQIKSLTSQTLLQTTSQNNYISRIISSLSSLSKLNVTLNSKLYRGVRIIKISITQNLKNVHVTGPGNIFRSKLITEYVGGDEILVFGCKTMTVLHWDGGEEVSIAFTDSFKS